MALTTGLPEASEKLIIEYPAEVLWALQQQPEEFAAEARLLLAVKLYETGKLSTGLAARLAGVPRSVFIFLLGRYGLSPFGTEADELAEDVENALIAEVLQAVDGKTDQSLVV